MPKAKSQTETGPSRSKRKTEKEKAVLREFRREDFDRVWEIDQECFPPGIAYPRRVLAAYLAEPGTATLVAERDGEILGYVVAARGRSETGHIITLDVTARARRAGLGSELMAAAEARLKAAGCRAVLLETAVDNSAALAFYKRHGYAVLRTLPRYYEGSVDALLLEKRLA